jgi:glucose/arabinose dehydrogenase
VSVRALLAAAAVALLAAAPAAAAPRLVPLGTFDNPTYVTGPPGDDTRVFVVERPGRIRVVRGGALLARPFLDVAAQVRSVGGEQGLLSMTFAPDYATSGRFFVYFTAEPDGHIEVREYRRSADPDVADPAVQRTLLRIPHPTFANHNGGQLQIGPDGMLWIGTGDGGGRDDPHQNAQDRSSELGKLLRVTLDGAIPADNPFPGSRIWAYGLRNPWRFSFDRATGALFIGDVGQSRVEEVDLAPAPGLAKGANWGWPCFEGTRTNTDTTLPCTAPGARAPFLERSHFEPDNFCSITGGYVVRDPGLPTLAGRYLFGDYCQPAIISVSPGNAGGARSTGLRVDRLSSFGEDTCGRIYAASLTGPVYRLQDGAATTCTSTGPPPPPPDDVAAPALDVTLAGWRKLGPRRRMRVRVECGEDCHAVVRARLPGLARLTTREADLTRGDEVQLRLKLSRREARRVRRARRGREVLLKVGVRASDAAGNMARDRHRRRLPER